MTKFSARAAGEKLRGFVISFGPAIVGITALTIANTGGGLAMWAGAAVMGVALAMSHGRGENAGFSAGAKMGAQYAIDLATKRPMDINVTLNMVNTTDHDLQFGTQRAN